MDDYFPETKMLMMMTLPMMSLPLMTMKTKQVFHVKMLMMWVATASEDYEVREDI